MKYRNEAPSVKLSTVATFPKHYFLENLAVLSDNSVLVTVLNHNELWYVPSSNDEQPVEPQLLFTFSHPAMGIVEVEPEVFYISASDIYTWKESYLYRLDLNGWKPGQAVHPESVLRFPQPIRGLNGSCVVAPGIILLADSWAGLIWRVDLHVRDGKPKHSVWLEHDSMGYLAKLYYDRIQLPGINGIQYSPKRGYLYYTASAKQLFMRVKVDPISFNRGDPRSRQDDVARRHRARASAHQQRGPGRRRARTLRAVAFAARYRADRCLWHSLAGRLQRRPERSRTPH